MAIAYNPKIVTDGLVLCLDAANPKSYPGTGTTWFDLSGNGNNGTMTGFTGPGVGTTSGFDPVTKLMMFDRHSGSSDTAVNNRVVIANSPSLLQCLVTNGVTISFWMRMTTYACTAMTKWDGSWEIYYCPSLVWRTQGTGGSDGNSGLAAATNLNKYHLITATHSGVERKFYINDELFYTNANTVTTQNTTNPISIGGYSNGFYATIGAIPYYSIYNRVLSSQEIQQNYNALKSKYFGYQTVVYTASANMTLTNNGTQDVTMFKTSNNNSWNGEVRSTESFSAPCTIEFSKQAGTTDNGVSYLMIGWNEDPTTNTSYTSLDHASYPYRSDTYSVYNNGSQVHFSGAWDVNKRFYIVYDTDGFIRHYNGSTLLYSANYGTNKTVFVDSSFYSVNSTFGGLTNVKVARSSWNGFSYV